MNLYEKELLNNSLQVDDNSEDDEDNDSNLDVLDNLHELTNFKIFDDMDDKDNKLIHNKDDIVTFRKTSENQNSII
eukprot:CAMPEP_0116890302 /NCGR_PEP_ID=MMETSP0467-20121206/838_1 /TAXON_ID=283647 /ORGANISM="Mesodinium pulex, Strain SPMC105" /LENGTH=75 /DNA_ID=CAMNT_0004557921 /DNA_START=694 /DNA_END=921 /DNA_ORIENTATION=-